jgi:inner membrane protein
MLGKTHLAVGIAASLVVLHPSTLPELVIGVGAAAVGAVISDIDVGTTESHRDADIISTMALVAVVAVLVLDKIFNIGVYDILKERSNIARVIVGALVFIGVCAFGKEQPHRSFMHSFLALIILSILVGVILPLAMPYFAVAFISHLATDLFNFKRVRLLYPLPGGISFHLFHAKGIANSILFMAGSVVSVAEIAIYLTSILGKHISI